MPHKHPVYDNDGYFVLDPKTKTLKNESDKESIIQFDHNSEEIRFKFPKIIEGHDMSKVDLVQVHFNNTSIGTSASLRTTNAAPVSITSTLKECEDDPEYMECAWLVGEESTQLAGSLMFKLKFICYGDDVTPAYKMNTLWYDKYDVLESSDSTEEFIDIYQDILSDIERRLSEAENKTITPEQISEVVNDYFEENPPSGGTAKVKAAGYLPTVKEWNVLGDSITYGEGSTTTYHKILKEKYDIPTVNNYGISATSIAEAQGYASAMCTRYSNMSDTADLITVFGGVNDFLHNVPIGVMGDTGTTTFYGGLKTLIEGLMQKYPNSNIEFITPLKCADKWSTNKDGTNTLGKTLVDYVEVIKEVCEYYSIPIIDLYSCSSLQPNFSFSNSTYFKDGLHPNEAGHNRLAEKIEQAFYSSCVETVDEGEDTDNSPTDYVYSLPQATVFDGTNYVDTGVMLFDEDKDFTVYLDIDCLANARNNVLLHCMNEAVNTYPGLSVAVAWDKDYYRVGYSAKCSTDTNGAFLPSSLSECSMKIAITHAKGTNDINVYYDDVSNMQALTGAHAGTFNKTCVLGAGRLGADNTGEITRHSKATFKQCKIYERVLSEAEISSLMGDAIPTPTYEVWQGGSY